MSTDVVAPPTAKSLPPGAVRWSLRTEVLTDNTHRTVPVAVDAAGDEVAEPKPPRPSPLSGMPWASIRHRMRHVMRPGVAVAGVVGVAALVDSYDTPAQYVAAGTVLATAAAFRLAPRYLIRGRLAENPPQGKRRPTLSDLVGKAAELVRRRQRMAAYVVACAGSWVTLAAGTGLSPATNGHPSAVTWAAGTVLSVVCGYPYVAHARPRVAEVGTLEEPATGGKPFGLVITARWSDTVGAVARGEKKLPPTVHGGDPEIVPAVAGGKLPGTVLENVHRVTGGWAADIVDPQHRGLDWMKDDVKRQVCSVFGVGLTALTLNPDTNDAGRCFVMVQREPVLTKVRHWAGEGIDLATGRAPTGTMADGQRTLHEFWRVGWGAVMELIAGATGSGKSELLNLLLAQERQSGVCVSWVADPQLGQSLGDVRDGVDWFAPTIEELVLMLRTAKQVVLARNVTTTRMRVQHPDGTWRRVKYVDPSAVFPLLCITVDEAHIPFNDPEFGKEIVRLCGFLAKSGRKANVKLRLITQSPLLSELKDSVLRSQVRSGLVTVFRVADRLDSASAFPGRMPVNPAELPDVWPDGSTTAGLCIQSGKPMPLRQDFPGDLYHVMREGTTLGLEDAVLGAAGKAYADRRARLAAFDDLSPEELLGLAEGVARATEAAESGRVKDIVLRVLLGTGEPMPLGELVKATGRSTRQVQNVLKEIAPDLVAAKSPYLLADEARERLTAEQDETDAELAEVAA